MVPPESESIPESETYAMSSQEDIDSKPTPSSDPVEDSASLIPQVETSSFVFQQVQTTYAQTERSRQFNLYDYYISPTEAILQSYTELLTSRSQISEPPNCGPSKRSHEQCEPNIINDQSSQPGPPTEYPTTVGDEIPTDWRMTQDLFTSNFLRLHATIPDTDLTAVRQGRLGIPIFSIYACSTDSVCITDSPLPPVDEECSDTEKVAEAEKVTEAEKIAEAEKVAAEPEAAPDMEEESTSASISPEGKFTGMSHRVRRMAMMRQGTRRSSRKSGGPKDGISGGKGRRARK